ncbi:MAG: hypothetical protein JW881_13465 [Spirochaetales bacterium]|nr:hypothetical protein [Spirochaetales bacterium]
MESRKDYRFVLIWIVLYAVAMGLLEAALVVYLRELYYPGNIRLIFPVTMFSRGDLLLELCREAATVVMILAVAVLVEKKKPVRVFACFVLIFGIWDLTYYLWLKVFINWPLDFLEWDVLFLIPWVWLGPWLCPALISVLFIVWGGIVLLSSRDISFTLPGFLVFLLGCILCLAAFLEPGLRILLEQGPEGFSTYMPRDFLWWLFLPGFLLVAAGLGSAVVRMRDLP